MIVEAFLTCALALPAAASPLHGDGHKNYLRLLVSEDRAHRYGQMLLVNATASRIHEMRQIGLRAFGALTLDFVIPSRYHAVSDPQALPFKPHTFFMVSWYHPNEIFGTIHYDYLSEIDTVLAPGGYLAFNPEKYPAWLPVLRLWEWQQMDTVFDAMPVYQKPDRNRPMPLLMGLTAFQIGWAVWWVIFPLLFIWISKITGKKWIREQSFIAMVASVFMLGFLHPFFWWYLVYCVILFLVWVALVDPKD